MLCAQCGSDTRVTRTVTVPAGLRRDRECAKYKHRFQTMEEPMGWRLEDTRVSNGPRVGDMFARSQLLDDVAKSARISADEANRIVDTAIDSLRRRIRDPEVLHRMERKTKGGDMEPVLTVDVDIIREEVQHALRSHGQPMLHVLYAMSFLGRTDRKGTPGWRKAENVLTWLYSPKVYPELKPVDEIQRPTVSIFEWAPLKHESHPTKVLKQPASDGTRRIVSFDLPTFLKSVQTAMDGRPHANKRAEYVTWLVLRPLTGQTLVTANQLGVAALDYLRQVDDIAYLRWVTIMKGITNIQDFHDEARGLVENPSPRLVFRDSPARQIELRDITPSAHQSTPLPAQSSD